MQALDRRTAGAMAPRRENRGEPHRFGGDWTDAKLQVLSSYLHAYTTALKNQRFRKWYIDGFAGTGSRSPSSAFPAGESGEFAFAKGEGWEESRLVLEGSARIALETVPAFDQFVFIERNQHRCEQLQDLRAEFKLPERKVQIHQGDANEALAGLPSDDWSDRRAVLFLDPYGMQVEWRTIEAIAKTGAIDLWVLFPLMGVSRVLTKSGEIPDSWARRLTTVLGTDSWRDRAYKTRLEHTLFGEEATLVRSGVEVIGDLFNERLREVFAGVAPRPGVLKNSKNSPLYLLCFAASNKNGAKIALRIAENLLKGMN
jgi:three-Cys-motif partner protein